MAIINGRLIESFIFLFTTGITILFGASLQGCFEIPTEELDKLDRISALDLRSSMRDHGFPHDLVYDYVMDDREYLNYPDAPERLNDIIQEHHWLRKFEYHPEYAQCDKLAEDFLAVVNNTLWDAPCGLVSHGRGFGHKELFLFYRKPGERLLTILLADHRSMDVRELPPGLHVMKIENLRLAL
jgi:hypothetical protein